MYQPNGAQLRVVDTILTEAARGYSAPSDAIADVLFPRIQVSNRAGKIIVFDKQHFLLANTQRAPGANTKRIQVGYGSGNYGLVDYSLEGQVPIENLQESRNGAPGVDLAALSIRVVQDRMGNEREYEAAMLARNAANYPVGNKATLSGSSQWNDPASNPAQAIQDAKDQIRAKIGIRPNVMVVGPRVLTALRNHPTVLASLSDQQDKVPATLDQLARLFELDRIVEGARTFVSDIDGDFQDMWGKDAILAYTTVAGLAAQGTPTFGYTYQLRGYPVVEEGYYERNPKSWFFPYTDARQPVIVGPLGGFLFQNAVA